MADTVATSTSFRVSPLERQDLDAVVAVDRKLTGASRRGYFERRLASAIRRPERHLQLAARGEEGLAGFVLARIAEGEYGRAAPVVFLESVGVDPARQHAGIGHELMRSLERSAKKRHIDTVVTQADWRDHAMLRFLAREGFRLAPRLLLDRKVKRVPLPETDEEIERVPPIVRLLRESDFDAVVRVDQRATGVDRSAYFRGKFDDVLQQSAIAVSLVVEDDGFVVGFGMARIDLGDSGHVEPTASLDTLGIDPSFAGKGYARDLLHQMIDNLAALHVERLETEVAHDHLPLARFFHRFGFVPSQRLVFEVTRG